MEKSKSDPEVALLEEEIKFRLSKKPSPCYERCVTCTALCTWTAMVVASILALGAAGCVIWAIGVNCTREEAKVLALMGLMAVLILPLRHLCLWLVVKFESVFGDFLDDVGARMDTLTKRN